MPFLVIGLVLAGAWMVEKKRAQLVAAAQRPTPLATSVTKTATAGQPEDSDYAIAPRVYSDPLYELAVQAVLAAMTMSPIQPVSFDQAAGSMPSVDRDLCEWALLSASPSQLAHLIKVYAGQPVVACLRKRLLELQSEGF